MTRLRMTRLGADLLLLLIALVWGIGFLFMKEAMDHIGVLTFIAARSLLAALTLLPLAVRECRGHDTDYASLGRAGAISGIVFALAAVLQQDGIRTATLTNTGFLTGLYVVFTPLAAWIIHRAIPAPVVYPAIALSFAGTWLLGGGTLEGFNRGDMLIAVSSLFWAVHVVVTGMASRLDRPAAFTAIQFATVAAIAAAGAAAFETPSWDAIRAAWLPIAFVGILSSAMTFTLLTLAMRHTPPSEAAVIVSTESLFAAAAGAIALGERMGVVPWTGAALIIAATLLVQVAPYWRSAAADGSKTS